MATEKSSSNVTKFEYKPTEKINLKERLDKIKYGEGLPNAKSIIASTKSSRGPAKSGRLSGLKSIKNTLGKQDSKNDLSDLLS